MITANLILVLASFVLIPGAFPPCQLMFSRNPGLTNCVECQPMTIKLTLFGERLGPNALALVHARRTLCERLVFSPFPLLR